MAGVHICSMIKKLALMAFFCLSILQAWAQPSSGASYDCEEQLFARFDKTTRRWGYKNIVGEWRVEPSFDQAAAFAGKLAIVQRGTKYGIINCEGYLVAGTQYDEIQNYVNGRGWARVGPLWGVLDEKGRLFVPPAFEEIRPISPRHDYSWVKKKGLWGIFYKERGKMLVEPQYDGFRNISDSLVLGLKAGFVSLVYVGSGQAIYDSCSQVAQTVGNKYRFLYRNKWGIIDASGNVKLRPEYDSLLHYTQYYLLQKGGLWGIADATVKITTPPTYQYARGAEGTLIAVARNKKWGLVLPSGQEVVPVVYADALPQWGKYYALRKEGKDSSWALMRKDLRLKNDQYIYRNVRYLSPSPLAEATQSDGLHKLVHLNTGIAYPDAYTGLVKDVGSVIYPYKIGATPTDTLWGMLQKEGTGPDLPLSADDRYRMLRLGFATAGKGANQGILSLATKQLVVSKNHTDIDIPAGTNLFRAHRSDSTFLFSETGRKTFSFSCQNAWPLGTNLYILQKDGLFGLLHKNGKMVLKPTFETLNATTTGADADKFPLIAQRKKQFLLVSTTGEKITDTYDTLYAIGQALYAAKKEGTLSLLDKQGKPVQAGPFMQVLPFAEGLLLVQDAQGWHYLNKTLKPAITQTYTAATPFANGQARVQQGGKSYIINKAGKILEMVKP